MKIHLVFGLLTVALLALVISSRSRERFGFENVVEIARSMAEEKVMSAVRPVPKVLRELNYDQLRDIRWRDDRTLWRREGLPFQARFFHPGGDHLSRSVEIYEVHGSDVRQVRYSPELFNFGKNYFPERLPDTIGYAGFRIHHPLNKPDTLDETTVFLGASYFRAVARDLQYGLSARGLAIGTGEPKVPEEFPVFTKFWMVKPTAGARTLTVYTLLESVSVMGAYQFDIEPGVETRMHVRVVLFFKKKTPTVGYAPLTSMFWFGENTSDTFGSFRPEVHDSDGLLLHTSKGEWIWRPLSWSRQVQSNAFEDDHPKGFGLLQRDRDFTHYQDLEALYHKRPSVWVQPLNGFDKGSIHLVQLPTDNEFMDNVVAFWRPETAPPLLEPVEFEYILRWFGEAADLPPLGRCVWTRVDFQNETYYRQFFLDFAGGPLDRLGPNEPPVMEVSSPTGAAIAENQVQWNEYNRSWRASFLVSTPEKNKPVELVCRLVANGEPMTETWTYTWHP